MTLEEAYFNLEKKLGGVTEPFEVIKCADDHRNFWKPAKVKTLLLAESHVYTNKSDYSQVLKYNSLPELEKCPKNYVRLVYCLGYGERQLVNLNNNTGTPQFWKIFVACNYKDFNSKSNSVLVSKTPNFNDRLQNKINLLLKLKEKGIWLMDASIVALYHKNNKPSLNLIRSAIEISWDQYVAGIISEIKPEKIIVIGKGVFNILQKKLTSLNIPCYVQSQPQARLSTSELQATFLRYYELCNLNK